MLDFTSIYFSFNWDCILLFGAEYFSLSFLAWLLILTDFIPSFGVFSPQWIHRSVNYGSYLFFVLGRNPFFSTWLQILLKKSIYKPCQQPQLINKLWQVDLFHSRDLDSRLSSREVAAVQEFLPSVAQVVTIITVISSSSPSSPSYYHHHLGPHHIIIIFSNTFVFSHRL